MLLLLLLYAIANCYVLCSIFNSSIAVCLVFASQQTPANRPEAAAPTTTPMPAPTRRTAPVASSYGCTRNANSSTTAPATAAPAKAPAATGPSQMQQKQKSHFVTCACWCSRFRSFREPASPTCATASRRSSPLNKLIEVSNCFAELQSARRRRRRRRGHAPTLSIRPQRARATRSLCATMARAVSLSLRFLLLVQACSHEARALLACQDSTRLRAACVIE